MRTVNAYGAVSATDPLVPMTIDRRDLGPKDVEIDIDYAGICHSDIHTVRGEWGEVPYPLVVGHEIVGRVAAVGAEVTRHAVGDLVGVGCHVNSCRDCPRCDRGLENHCEQKVDTYNSIDRDGTVTHGGYSEAIVTDEHFVMKVPESLDESKVAPLLCAGITTYSPLRRWNVGPGSRVGVVGLGGLGHMGVKIAVAMGAEVTVFSRTEDKRGDAVQLGAHHFVTTRDENNLRELRSSFDFILNTVSADLKISDYLELLDVDGVLVNVGVPPKAYAVHPGQLIGGRRTFSGSNTGGMAETQEMLDFCAEHGIHPDTELISADRINEAYRRVLDSDVRYRFVIDASTLAG